MKIKLILPCLLFILALSACSKWIDVKPSDRLSEDVLFENKEGYLKALNGIYVELNNNSLYGSAMTTSVVDVLAQYYVMPVSTHSYFAYATFDYTSLVTKAGFDNAWKKGYELIVNCNVIIDKCGDNNPLLPKPYFGIVKGEALALRAMLHLDMLRLFGPIWSEQSKSTPCIPYTTSPEVKITPLLTADQVMNHILEDLAIARDLLETSDPILTEGVRNGPNTNGTNDLYYRQYRINYYAVKALMARAYMWKGDKVNAALTAKNILAKVQLPPKPIFPYVVADSAKQAVRPDRVFSTEVFFALYTINRSAMYDNLFSPGQLSYNRLSFNIGDNSMARVDEMYDDANDYRYRIWENVNTTGVPILTNMKYKDYAFAQGRNMIPLVRLSEMLLTVAECATDLNEGKTYLNMLRTSRGAISLSPANADELKIAITREFRREFIGEGQMFFYYKRNSLLTIPNHAAVTGTKAMVAANYVVPLPDSEKSLRN